MAVTLGSHEPGAAGSAGSTSTGGRLFTAAPASSGRRRPMRRRPWPYAGGQMGLRPRRHNARNGLKETEGRLALIDWDWAGLDPRGYELAPPWFSLVEAPGGRGAVESADPSHLEAGFLLSAAWSTYCTSNARYAPQTHISPGTRRRSRTCR